MVGQGRVPIWALRCARSAYPLRRWVRDHAWHGCVARTPARRASRAGGAARDAAELLGNTPAVARKSYVDPRVIDAYLQGETIGLPTGQDPATAFADRALWAKAERATLALLNNGNGRTGRPGRGASA